ncbi:MAG: DUF3048 domain-containing protein [bacterium]|nr:DUF3048 domain-containing protein [bacterium]MDZ4296614.1 DUF3048 domain-containing protein [Patescibacteria group bacterium]
MHQGATIFFLAVYIAVLGAAGIFLGSKRHIDIKNSLSPEQTQDRAPQPSPSPTPVVPTSPITGLPCDHADRRPIAVMLSGDPATRPLSGLSEADLIIEMPVTASQITRLMALYQCHEPKDIGSVRSARHDFLPLAASFGAIYAHWGGSHFALDQLKTNILDNIDALPNPFGAFYRKRGIAPHNGFTDFARLWNAAINLKYTLIETPRQYFAHINAEDGAARQGQSEGAGTPASTIQLPYNGRDFAVRWEYDTPSRRWRRFRGNAPEIDKHSRAQVTAAVVVVLKTTQKHLEDQYIDVAVLGRGSATVYQLGSAVSGAWVKTDFDDILRIIDVSGKDIALTPGNIWIEMVTQ